MHGRPEAPSSRAGARRASWFRRHPISGALAVSAAAVVVAAAAWLFPRAAEPPSRVSVPALVGVAVEQAEASLGEVGLVGVRQPGAEAAAAGVVLAQEPAAGARVRKGSQVTLVVSVPSTSVEVPSVVGLDVDVAQELLAGSDLLLVREGSLETAEVPADQVVEQSPAASTVVDRGTQVRVRLSKEPPAAARIVLADVGVSVQDGIGVLELTVRNDGGQVAIVTDVVLTITGYANTSASGGLQPSATYDAALPALGSSPSLPVRVLVPVAQVVDPVGPGAVDKFAVRLSPGGGGSLGHIYTFTVGVQEASSQDVWEEPLRLSLVASTAFSGGGGSGDSTGPPQIPEPSTGPGATSPPPATEPSSP